MHKLADAFQAAVGNIVNRVFDSSGPEGKVRGTPQPVTCPWCEAELMTAVFERDEGDCPECLTHWEYEYEAPEVLALAA